MSTIFYFFLRWCPGGLGIFLRQKLYPYILGSCGKKVLLGRFVTLKNPKKIHLGNNVVINDNVSLDANGFSEQRPAIITIEDNVFIGSGSRLHAMGEKIVLKSGTSVGTFCVLKSKGAILIGEHVLLAAFCRVGDYSEKYKPISQNTLTTKSQKSDIIIETDCWLGVRSIILPGVFIGMGSIVGAHAVVQKSLHSNVVAVGNPAEVMRNRFEYSEKFHLR